MGHESFLLTVQSVTAKDPFLYAVQESVTVQGFTHDMVLVTICSCPAITGLSNIVEEGMAEVVH